MNHRQQAKLPAARNAPMPPAQARSEATPRREWKPEDPKIGRAELRRIIIEMIG